MPSTRDSSRKKDDSNENNVDIEVLRKEYRNMQANRNAFAHESDLVRKTHLHFPLSTLSETHVLFRSTMANNHRY